MPLYSSRSFTTVGLCLLLAGGGQGPTVAEAGLPHPPSARAIHVPLRCDWTPEEPPLQLAPPLQWAPPLAAPPLAAPRLAAPTFPTTTVRSGGEAPGETPHVPPPVAAAVESAPVSVTDSAPEDRRSTPDALPSPVTSEPPLPSNVPLPMTTVERATEASPGEMTVPTNEPIPSVSDGGAAERPADSPSGADAISVRSESVPPAPPLTGEVPDPSSRADRSFPAQEIEAPVDRLALADSLFAAGESAIALDVYSAIDLETVAPASRSWVRLQIAACYRRAGQTEEALRRYRELVTTTDPAWVGEYARWWIRAADADRTRIQDVENLGTAVQQLQEAVTHELQ